MSEIDNIRNYLDDKNFSNLVEWMTTEVILNQPNDPIIFCNELLNQKINSRKNDNYDPNDVLKYSNEAYSKVTTQIDGNVMNTLENNNEKEEKNDEINKLNYRLEKYSQVINSCRQLSNEIEIENVADKIINICCNVLEAERATLFLYHPNTKQLISTGLKKIIVEYGQGLVFASFLNKELINITDAYNDTRFDSTHDQKSGFVTRSVLTAPLINFEGDAVGVLQLLNKTNNDSFNDTDEELLNLLTSQAGVIINNAQFYHNSKLMNEKFRSLIDLIKSLQSDLGMNSLIFTLTEKLPNIIGAEKCSVFQVNFAKRTLLSLQGDFNKKLSLDNGIAGTVARTGDIINVKDAYNDERFNQEIDKKSGFQTKSILCLPIKSDDQVIAVIQLINKKDDTEFFDEDVDILSYFLSIAGPILKKSPLFQTSLSSSSSSLTEGFEKGDIAPNKNKLKNRMSLIDDIVEEEDDEEEDDDDEDEDEKDDKKN